MTPMEQVVTAGMWAPSGDNEQPWRVSFLGDDRCRVTVGYFLNTPFHLDRLPDHITLGCFLENAHLAASAMGKSLHCELTVNDAGKAPVYELSLRNEGAALDCLAGFIEKRTVNRFPYSPAALTPVQKEAIAAALPSGYTISWFDGPAKKKFADMAFCAGRIRYMLPEMFETHSKIIDWNNELSPTGLPAKTLGVPLPFLPMLRWILGSWGRMQAYNRYFAGDWVTALQLELVPTLLSGAGIAIIAQQPPMSALDWVEAGRAIQRFWLAAAAQGLVHQPAFTPLVFSKYVDLGKPLTQVEEANKANERLQAQLSGVLGGDDVRKRTVWLGRVGRAAPMRARSIRLPLASIIQNG